MKTSLAVCLLAVAALVAPTAEPSSALVAPTAEPSSARPAAPSLPAFPGAEGGGALSEGGRGGRVIQVTNLDDRGPGSLRAALAGAGRRTVVFRVAGTIDLRRPLIIDDPYVTVAGQSAPAGGITLRGTAMDDSPLLILTHDVVIRYLRIRTGRGPSHRYGAGDVVSLGEGGDVHDIVLDHNSFSWGNDENVAVWADEGTARDITISNNIVSEALDHDDHSTGLIAGSNEICEQMTDIDVVRNLFAHNSHRNPYVKVATSRVVNNVVYNWDWLGTQIAGGIDVDIIANHYIPGPDDAGRSEIAWRDEPARRQGPDCDLGPQGDPSIHLRGNIGPHQPDPWGEQWSTMLEQVGDGNGWGWPGEPPRLRRVDRALERTWPLADPSVPVTVWPARRLVDRLLPTVGASRRIDGGGNWVGDRDAIDRRIVREVRRGAGRIRLTEDDAGGYAEVRAGRPYDDRDADGMANWWERRNGFDPRRADGHGDRDADGYTNVEEFLNGTQP